MKGDDVGRVEDKSKIDHMDKSMTSTETSVADPEGGATGARPL